MGVAMPSSSQAPLVGLRPGAPPAAYDERVADSPPKPAPLRWGQRTFAPTDLAVMAIVNVTPDSFVDHGLTFGTDLALDRIAQLVDDGADIVDIGGVKAGAGTAVDLEEELARIVPVIERARARFPDLVISVDTWRSEVADVACRAGADVVNDAWAGADPQLVDVVARHDAGLVCTHTGGMTPRSLPHRVWYDEVVTQVRDELHRMASAAVDAGVRRDGIVIDPTHDFGKNTRHSLSLTRHTDALVATGWPVLMAMSRKDFVGESLNLPTTERLEGTLAATAVAAWLGGRIFRAHDVVSTRRVLQMVVAIRGDIAPLAGRRALA
jgi:dihydropteroate synthase